MTLRFIALAITIMIGLAGCSSDTEPIESATNSPRHTDGTEVHAVNDRGDQPRKLPRRTMNNGKKPGAKTARNGVNISGAITRSDGSPIAGATVRVWTMPNDYTTSIPWTIAGETETDRNGRYRLNISRDDKLAVTARAKGYAVAATKEIERKKLPPGSNPYRVDLELAPEVTLAGRVVDDAGVPVAEAHVLGDQPGDMEISMLELQTFTDADGRFTLRGAAAGNGFRLAVKPTTGVIELHSTTSPNTNVEVKLKGKAPRLDGRIVGDNLDLLVTQTTVTLNQVFPIPGLFIREPRTVASDGTFDFGPVAPRDTALSVRSSPMELTIVDSVSKTRYQSAHTLKMDEKSTTVLIHVMTGQILRARVVDVATSAVLPGVEVFKDKGTQSISRRAAKTDQNGFFTLQVTHPEMISLESPTHHNVTPTDELKKFADDYSLTHTIVMKRAPFIRGIIEGTNGEPVAGAELVEIGYKQPVSIESGGTFKFKSHPGANYSFMATAPGYAPAYSDKITIQDDDINDVRLQLNRGRRASGIVVDPVGNPVAGAKVSGEVPSSGFPNPMYSPSNPQQRLGTIHKTTRTDSSGRFTLPLLPTSKNIRIIAEAAGYAHPVFYSDIASEADLTGIKLQLPASIAVHGKVVNEAGSPVPNAMVIYHIENDSLTFYDYTDTSTSGTFHFASMPKGATGSLSISHSDYDSYRQDVEITDTNVSITLNQSALSAKFDMKVECLDLADNSPVSATLAAKHVGFTDSAITIEPDQGKPGRYTIKGVIPRSMLSLTTKAKGYREESHFEQNTKPSQTSHKILMRKLGTIKGRVVDAETKDPIPGATIHPYSTERKLATSDDSGKFEFQNEQSYSSAIYAQAPDGNRSDSVQAPVLSGDSYDLGDLEVRGKQPFTVRVVRGKSASPVKDVAVELTTYDNTFQHQTEAGTTNADGEFTVDLLPVNIVTIRLPDFGVLKQHNLQNPDGQEHIVICQVGNGVFRGKMLLDGKEVEGRIYGVLDKAESLSASTEVPSSGKFLFENLMPGSWKFTATTSGKRHSTAVRITIPPDDNPVERNIEITSNRVLTALVVDEDDKPVSEATVRLLNSSNNSYGAVTNADGEGRFNVNPEPGNYRVTASHHSFGTSPGFAYTVPETGELPELKITLKPYSGTITCTALSIIDGLPVPGIVARLRQGQDIVYEVTQRGTGAHVTIENIKPGAYQLEVTAIGYSKAIHQVVVEEEQPLEFTDVLSPAANISVTVVDKNGSTIEGAVVSVTPSDFDSLETMRSTITTEDGKASFEGVLSGNYQLQAISPDGAAGTGSFSTRHQSAGSYQLIVE